LVYYLKILPFNEILPSLTYQKYKIACGIILGVLFSIFVLTVILKKNEEASYYRLMKLLFFGMIGITAGALLFPNLQKITKRVENPDENFYQYWQHELTAEADMLHSNGQLPDIYYIILDGYGRKDVLAELYDFDNQPFLSTLADQGLDISENSFSNYKQTDLSISSLLNFDYVNWVGSRNGISENDYLPIYYLVQYNRVFEQLRRIGYRINSFSSAYELTKFDTVDAMYRSGDSPNNFETMIIEATPLSLFWDQRLYAIHRVHIRYGLQNMAKVGAQQGPDFVFVHVPAPHPPFVFGPDGEEITADRSFTIDDASDFRKQGSVEEYKAGYVNQLMYVNKEVLAAVQEILMNSGIPPIIIIQGDHGPGSEFNHQILEFSNLSERYPILFASYIPCGQENTIPNDITPVNSFRYIFNFCFNANLPYLDNRQFYSSNIKVHDFTDVTERLLDSMMPHSSTNQP
jgi:hypothetical protein